MGDAVEKTGKKSGRIQLLDVLRGFAILGTLGTNIWLFSTVGSGSIVLGAAAEWWTSLDAFVMASALFFTNGKFLGLLTIMFGVGLEILYQRSQRRNLPWIVPYLWRSSLLFLDGLLHYFLVVEFDILMGYAMTAMIVAFVVGCGDRAINATMWVAASLHVLLFGSLTLLVAIYGDGGAGQFAESYARMFNEGSYLDQVAFRFENFGMFRVEAFGVIPISTFLFLLGVKLMRSGAFSPDERGRSIRRRLLRWGFGLGIPLNLLVFLPNESFEILSRYFFASLMSLGIIGLVAWALERGLAPRLADRLEEIGKMALSCYMLQNIIASVIFYGWGLGLTGQSGAFLVLATWAGISVSLMLFSNLWLRRFPNGPFEGVWKRLVALAEPKNDASAGPSVRPGLGVVVPRRGYPERAGGGMGNGLEEMAAAFDPRVRDLAARTRALIEDVYPEVVEVPWPGQNVVGYGVGPKKMSEHFCYVALHNDYVNLGFNQGAELPDPEGLLEGPMLRHRKIAEPEDLEDPALRRLLEAAKPTACRPDPPGRESLAGDRSRSRHGPDAGPAN